MKTILPIFLACICWHVAYGAGMKQTVVNTSLGSIQGIIPSDSRFKVKQFLGVPFAQPPVGELRFKKPEKVKPWNTVFVADNNDHACVQYTKYPLPWADFKNTSEDCLYLNIFTPISAKNGSDLAVIFFIHGGGFSLGSNRNKIYDGTVLASQGNVIVVTINYRLGLFGFLTSETDDAPGNAGFYDIIMALQWVRDNIEFFGGNKNKITVQGQNAGSLATSLLCVSPMTKGMFNGAILESAAATVLKFDHKQKNLDLGQQLAKAVGCASDKYTIKSHPKKVVNCLREKDSMYLAKKLFSFHPHEFLSFFPQFDDAVLPRNAVNDIRKGRFHNVPILIGNNKDEGSFQITTRNPDVFGFHGEKNAKINKTEGEKIIRDNFKNFTNPEKYVNYYLGNISDEDHDEIRRQVYTASGDYTIICQTVYLAEKYAEKGNDVYFYVFEHRPSKSPWASWMGTTDFDEMEFVFGMPIKERSKYPAKEKKLSAKLVKIWTHFAKYGYPSDDFEWPKYSTQNHTYMIIDTKFNGNRIGSGPQLENCNFLRDYYGF